MMILKKVASNTVYQLLGKLFTTVSTLVITVFITRMLGADSFGEYSIVISFVTPFFVIADFGVNAIIAGEFTADNSKIEKKFKSALFLRILIAIFLVLLGVALVQFTPYTDVVKKSIMVGFLLVFFHAVFGACNIIFQTFLTYQYPALGQFLSSVASLVLTFILILGGGGVFGAVAGYVAGKLFMPLTSLYFVRKFISPNSRLVDVPYWKETLTSAFPIGFALILNVSMISADRIILSLLSTPYSVGIYSLAYRIFDVVLVLPTFFMNAMYPLLVRSLKESRKKYEKTLGFSITAMFLSYILVLFTGLLVFKRAIPLIWGFDMALSYKPLVVLIVGSVAFFLSAPLSWALVVQKKQKVLPYIYGSGFLLNVFLNLVFIPKYDYMAAATVTVLTEVLVLMSVYYFALRRERVRFRVTFFLK